jgi:hypothetical protein
MGRTTRLQGSALGQSRSCPPNVGLPPLINISAFAGTNRTGELITSRLPVIRGMIRSDAKSAFLLRVLRGTFPPRLTSK